MNLFISISIILSFTYYVTSSRILGLAVWPSYSHQVFYRPIWKELAKRGHEIVLLTTDPMENPPENIKQIDLHFAYDVRHKVHNTNKQLQKVEFNPFKILRQYENLLIDLMDKELEHPEVQKIINNKTEHFDLVMTEMLMLPMYHFSPRFNCPYIILASTDLPSITHNFYGNPGHPLIYPTAYTPMGDRRSFKNRVKIFVMRVISAISETISPFGYNLHEKVTKKHFGENSPSYQDVARNVSMVFLNSHPAISSQRPLGPGFIEIGGGMHFDGTGKPLPKDIKEFVDDAQEGFIYFSLGTNVLQSHLSTEMINAFVGAFKELPYKVLWKFESQLKNISDNVKIVKWLPQQDLLKHKNLKLMIYQCGIQSTEEALMNEIPVIGIPFISDQKKIASELTETGVGKFLDKQAFTKDQFKDAIVEVITNPTYKENAKRVATLLQDNPLTGLEKAVWWTEFVIRHKGTPHFWNKHTHIPLYQYLFLDAFAVVFLVFGLVFYILYKLLKLVVRCFYKPEKSQKQKKQ